MRIGRRIKYFYFRFLRLRGDPRDLALGMTCGIFAGLLPVLPFQTALAVTLAIFFKASKITAVLGTWVSNPLNWYFLYYFSYKIGATVLGLSESNRRFLSIMAAVNKGEEGMIVAQKIAGAGGVMIAAFLIGGLMIGLVCAVPSYFICLKIFRVIAEWRKSRRRKKGRGG